MKRRLPPLIEELSEVIGLPATLDLCKAKGGQRVSIPATVYKGHWLEETLGLETARQLCGYLTNGRRVHLEVPKAQSVGIEKLIKQGKSINQIAQILGVTSRTVFYHKASLKSEPDPKQPKLF